MALAQSRAEKHDKLSKGRPGRHAAFPLLFSPACTGPKLKDQPVSQTPAAPRFAQGLCPEKLFWVLLAGSVFGVVWEHLVNLVCHGRFYGGIGLVWGPFNLVYGFGAVLFTLLLWPLRKRPPLQLLLLGMAVGSGYEVACAVLQRRLCGAVSWSYEGQFLALPGGATSLPVAFAWGLLALFYTRSVYPRLSALIERIPPRVGRPLTWALAAFLALDAALSLAAVLRMQARAAALPAATGLGRLLDHWFPDLRLQSIFPGMFGA